MRKLALLSCVVLASATVTTTADARHRHHKLQAWDRAPAAERLTTVGTPDCHVQGRLLRAANHCPPEAISAAPR
jgi:hypothetical protein